MHEIVKVLVIIQLFGSSIKYECVVMKYIPP